jgi:hypothetical protein
LSRERADLALGGPAFLERSPEPVKDCWKITSSSPMHPKHRDRKPDIVVTRLGRPPVKLTIER